jgi:xanthine dehydrogenase accessory factor
MNHNIHRRIADLIDERRSFAVATVVETCGSVPAKLGARMIVFPDGSQEGTVGGAAVEESAKKIARKALAGGKSGLFKFGLTGGDEKAGYAVCGGEVTIYVEKIRPKPHVLIFGGGHIALDVARLCDQLEYHYSVVDDRAEFVAKKRFPSAKKLFHQTVEDFFADCDLRPYSHLLICTYGHQHDAEAALGALMNFKGYIGMIGSKTKRAEIRKKLAAQGISSKLFDKIHCPVGLKIGAESVPEIAVSIIAEIIADDKRSSKK